MKKSRKERNSEADVRLPGENAIKSLISIESGIHGLRWQKFHSGYFADPLVAAPYVETILETACISKPGFIVDLGGGTGFILRELINHSIDPNITLVNLDLSNKQLRVSKDDRIFRVRRSMAEFIRADVRDERSRILFVMRSALHYVGRSGLKPFLRHLRTQMTKSEFFVHQTACFDKARDARCLNELYRQMGTGKWYPTRESLLSHLDKEGLSVISNEPAPALTLESQDLGKRYKLSKTRLTEIRDDLVGRFGEKENVFELTSRGFRAFLHYRIFTCAAR